MWSMFALYVLSYCIYRNVYTYSPRFFDLTGIQTGLRYSDFSLDNSILRGSKGVKSILSKMSYWYPPNPFYINLVINIKKIKPLWIDVFHSSFPKYRIMVICICDLPGFITWKTTWIYKLTPNEWKCFFS